MEKNKGISVLGVIFSSIALVASIVELIFCIIHQLSIILMPILLIVMMGTVLIANIINLLRVNNHNKHLKKG